MSNVRVCKVIQVIQVVFKRGKGTDDDLLREVTQYRTLEGELIAKNDPCAVLSSLGGDP